MDLGTMYHDNKWMVIFLSFLVVCAISICGGKINAYFEQKEKEDEFELISKHLLSDDASAKPRLWVHSSSSSSGVTALALKSINACCGEYFTACVVSDDTFSQYIPTWTEDSKKDKLNSRDRIREYGMVLLLYLYGGIIVPESFLCFQCLSSIYLTSAQADSPLLFATPGLVENRLDTNRPFLPDPRFMAAPKKNTVVHELLHFICGPRDADQFSNSMQYWCLAQHQKNKMIMFDGKKIGVKDTHNRAIMLEHLMEEKDLALEDDSLGIYIPLAEMRKRLKYKWFANLPEDTVLKTSTVLSKYIRYTNNKRNHQVK
jgi:hypothetical protein